MSVWREAYDAAVFSVLKQYSNSALWVTCVLVCELRNVPLTLKQQCERKAVFVLSHIHSGLFNESLKSIWNGQYQTFVLSTPQIQ